MSNLLNIGKSGLDASRKALRTTSHNMANVNNEGYSRQRVVQTSNIPLSKDGLIQGTGVRVKTIERISDQYAEKRLSEATSEFNYYESRNAKLAEIETIFNELDSAGLNKVLNDFYNSFRELANQPEDSTMRSVVLDKAKLVVRDIQQARQMLDNVATGIDKSLEFDVDHVNIALEQLSSLNEDIKQLEAEDQEVGDLKDQRDLIIKDLSQYFQIHTFHDNNNDFSVIAKGVGTLISGKVYTKLDSARMSEERSENGMPGSVSLIFEGRTSKTITPDFKGGKFAAIAKIRNEDVKGMQDKMDRIAYELARTVNTIHRRGFVNRPIQPNEEGRMPASDMYGPVTNIDFFKQPIQIKGAAHALEINKYIVEDPNNIATALEPNKPGDNRVAIAISKLQHEKVMGGGENSLEEEYLQMIGTVGLEKGKSQLNLQQSEALMAQAKQIRERYSGVSLDEEAANLIRYQQAYEASAKVMKTAEEMFQTVLNIKR